MSPRPPLAMLLIPFLLGGLLLVDSPASAEVYELRTYTTHPGKLADLNARFRDHTVRLFAKHGMESVGYWVPTDGPEAENTLIYVLKHKSREAAAESWKGFLADDEWRRVAAESQKEGPILAKRPESVFMAATAYTPKFSPGEADAEAVFELRIYHCNEGKLPLLDARFRDHTIRLFSRHGMQSGMYWHPVEEPAASDTLIYFLRHKSRAAAEESWKGFRSDAEWLRVAEESQREGQFLRERPTSIYLRATDYSAIR